MADSRTIDCHLDVGKVNSYYKLASSIEWRRAVYEELYGIVDTWVWEHDLMAEMATLLLYATHIQTFWDWRPNVSLDGQTDSGKTEWVEFMKDVYFGWLCTYSDTSAAAIRQSIGRSAVALNIDEFDAFPRRHREDILKLLRGSSQGQEQSRGTPGQRRS